MWLANLKATTIYMGRYNLKKLIVILAAILISVTSLVACARVITNEETTGRTELIETNIPIILTTVAITEPTKPEQNLFGNDIAFSCEYIANGKVMPYALYTPSKASEGDSIPLIVWLHGSGEKDVGKATFFNRGLPKVLNEWTLEGFNAYVLCPHLYGKWNPGEWASSDSLLNLQTLLDTIIDEYNVDPDRIIISGSSLGGIGATYMAWKLQGYFSKLVVVSGYRSQAKLDEITIPAICFAGTVRKGEHEACVKFMEGEFASTFGKENTFSRETSHSKLPSVIFNEDKDENGRSDLIEWMLEN